MGILGNNYKQFAKLIYINLVQQHVLLCVGVCVCEFEFECLSEGVGSVSYAQSFLISKVQSHLRCICLSSSVNTEDTE